MALYNLPGAGKQHLELARLVEQRRSELDIHSPELVRRWGYKNTSKGLRRLEQLQAGQFVPAGTIMEALAKALDLPVSELLKASETTKRQLDQARLTAQELEWRDWSSTFRPHAILRTERQIPSPVFVVALVGAENILRVNFDHMQPTNTWMVQVTSKLPVHVAAFGLVTGFYLNYSPELAVECDRDGSVVREFPKARRPGHAWMEYKGRDVTGRWQTLLTAEQSKS